MGEVWVSEAYEPNLVRADSIDRIVLADDGLVAELGDGDRKVVLLRDPDAKGSVYLALLAAIERARDYAESTVVTAATPRSGGRHDFVWRIDKLSDLLQAHEATELVVVED